MKYHLRFQIVPGADVASRASSLTAFCHRSGVEEVVLFIAAEEWNNGLLSKSSWEEWKACLQCAKTILEGSGLAVSLNPWMTILHSDRGRRMPSELSLERMVSPSGGISKACASFGDEKFVTYIREMYRSFAELGFRVIWIEDDFRYHNHYPLDWGGGFEDCILQEFSRRIGRPVSREEVVKNILLPGPPHPWRSQWMELWFDLQCEVAKAMAGAVREGGKGHSILGLMSSSPSAHSVEGRDWKRLFSALEISGRLVHRPNFAPYEDTHSRFHSLSIQALDLQKRFRKDSYEVAPEIENMPFSNWAKSDRQTWMEMALTAFSGADAVLLDLFSFCGNDVDDEPLVETLLIRSRPALDWISKRFSKDLRSVGVEVLWREDASRKVETKQGRNMQELITDPFAAGHFLLRYGVPVSHAHSQKVAAIFGDIAWAIDESVLLARLDGGLLLDGTAAWILYRRGFGEMLGLKNISMISRDSSNYSLEAFRVSIDPFGVGLKLSCNSQPGIASVEPQNEAMVWSDILRADGSRLCPGALGWDLPQGGRIAILAAASPNILPPSHPRQLLTQRIIRYLEKEEPRIIVAIGSPHIYPMQFENGANRYWVLLNASTDPAIPAIDGSLPIDPTINLLKPLESPVTLKNELLPSPSKARISCPFEIPHMGFAVFSWSI